MQGGDNEEISVRKEFGGWQMIQFISGCFVGGTIGVFAMCLCFAAKEADRYYGVVCKMSHFNCGILSGMVIPIP